MNKNRTIFSHLFFLLIFLLANCSKKEGVGGIIDEEEDTDTYGVDYVINAKRSMDPNATEEEMMKSILLIIVNAANQIEEVIDVQLPQTVEQYTVECQLTPGEKEMYGFANLTPVMRSEAGLAGINKGQTMPDLSSAVLTIENGYQIDSIQNKWLPMSNRIQHRVTKLNAQKFSMELVRLVCKIGFTFKNETGNTMNLKQIRMSPLTNSPVYLLPYSGNTPVFPSAVSQEEYTYPLDASYTFKDQEELSCLFYVNESYAANGDWFQLKLITQQENGSNTEERMAVTDLSVLNRNDYLPLSLILSDYKLELNVRSYPPIGGYPAYLVKDQDGYHCHFSGGGPFVIIPSLIRLSDNSVVEVSDSDWTFTYEDTIPGFFDELPVMENGEIKGSIKTGATGNILVTISAGVVTSGNITRILSYKVYISQ